MIDNPKQVTALLNKLRANLPIPTQATDALASNLRENSINIRPGAQIEITDIMYMGDEGGICCALKITDQDESAVIVSITHLRILNIHPLSSDVRAYQMRRTKKLSKIR